MERATGANLESAGLNKGWSTRSNLLCQHYRFAHFCSLHIATPFTCLFLIRIGLLGILTYERSMSELSFQEVYIRDPHNPLYTHCVCILPWVFALFCPFLPFYRFYWFILILHTNHRFYRFYKYFIDFINFLWFILTLRVIYKFL